MPLQQIVYIAVWESDGELQVQAFETREAADRDFPASEFSDVRILQSTVQR